MSKIVKIVSHRSKNITGNNNNDRLVASPSPSSPIETLIVDVISTVVLMTIIVLTQPAIFIFNNRRTEAADSKRSLWINETHITKHCSHKRGCKRDFPTFRYIVTNEFYTTGIGRRVSCHGLYSNTV